MPVVQMPDGQLVDMPDNPSGEQLQAIQQLASHHGVGATPQTALGLTKNLGAGVMKGVEQSADLVAGAPRRSLETVVSSLTGAGNVLPDLGKVEDKLLGIEAERKAFHDLLPTPKTTGEKYAKAIGEGIGGAFVGPGGETNAAKTAIIGALSGAGSEGSAQMFGDTALNRVLGGLIGGMTGGLGTAAKTNKEMLAREALADVSPQDLATAVERMQANHTAGIPINLSQAMPRASNIDAYVEALANSKYGKETIKQLRDQPHQIAFGVEEQLAGLPGQIRMPQILANNAQEAADSAIRQGMKEASNAWSKFAPQDASIPQNVLAQFDKHLQKMAAGYPNTAQADLINDVREALLAPKQSAVEASSILGSNGQPLNTSPLPDKYLSDALQVKGAIDDVLQNFGARKLNTPGLQGKELRRAQEIRSLFRDIIDNEVPDLAQANRAYEAVMTGTVEPLKKSVVGRLAGRLGANAQQEAPQAKLFSIFNKGTVPGASSSEILTVEKAFRTAGQPEVYQDAAKSWVADKISTALKSTDNRMPDNVGERLRIAFGDPRQLDQTSKGFEDVLAGLARSQGVPEAPYVRGFKQFMTVVSDAARRPGTARGIAPQEAKEMASEGLGKHIGNLSLMTPIRQPALAWARFLEADALGKMDELLTSPEGVATLIKLGKQQPFSQSALTTMATFLGTHGTLQSDSNDNSAGLQWSNTGEK